MRPGAATSTWGGLVGFDSHAERVVELRRVVTAALRLLADPMPRE